MVFDQAGIGLELRVGDPALAHRLVERDQFVEPALDLRLVEDGLARVEIEPPLSVADRPSGHRIGRHDREQVQRGMGAHALVTQLPVDAGDDARARRGQGGALGRDVQNGRAVGVVDRVEDRNRRPVVEQQRPSVAALPSALGIKDSAIEGDSARFGLEHDRFRFDAIGVIAKQGLRHCTNTAGAPPLACSQSGMGRFFERRKAGLNSLEA